MKKTLALLFVINSIFGMDDVTIKSAESREGIIIKLVTSKYIAKFTKRRIANGLGNVKEEQATPYGVFDEEYLVDCQIKTINGAEASDLNPNSCNKLINKMLDISRKQAEIKSAKKSILEEVNKHNTLIESVKGDNAYCEGYPYPTTSSTSFYRTDANGNQVECCGIPYVCREHDWR